MPDPAISTDATGIAICGFDPVAYADGSAARGDQAYFAVTAGAVWLFASDVNRRRFLENPDAFLPNYGGYCTTCLAGGNKVHSDPGAFARIEGRTYLFSTKAMVEGFGEGSAESIRQANAQWTLLAQEEVSPAPPVTSVAERRAWDQIPVIEAARTAIAAGNHVEALRMLKGTLAFVTADSTVQADAVSALGGLSFRAVIAGEDNVALEAADLALGLDDDETWIDGNRAYALMFTGDIATAREILMRNRGSLILEDRRLWDEVVLEDFDILRKAGRETPLMDEIEALFRNSL